MNRDLLRFWLTSGIQTELRAKKNRWFGKLFIGENVRVGKKSCLDRYMGGNIHIGEGSVICQNCKIATCGGDIHLGKESVIGDGAVITAQGGVIIGNQVLFADRVSIIANEHVYIDVSLPIMRQGSYTKKIVIEDGTWIGINATILQGTHIGKNCVVGAGAVVKGKFPDYCVIAGNPARIVKKFDSMSNQWIRLSDVSSSM